MLTVGFGDVIPKNEVEMIFVIIVTIISCGIFAYCLQTISSIIQNH